MRIAALLALTLVTAPTLARAQAAGGNAAAAQAKRDSAKQHYGAGEFGAALADLAEAYHLDPQPDLLYAMAKIEVELGDCAGAVAHYKQYLATNPPEKARVAATQAKEACEAKLGNAPTTTEPVKPPPPPDKIAPPPPKPEPVVVSRPFYKDGLGDGLFAGGVVAGAAGLGLYLVARKDIDDSETAATLQAHDDLVNKAHDLRTYAVIAGGVGGALAVAAIVRWATHGGGTETRDASVGVSFAPSPDGTGWGFAAVGRF
jgi:tetratricopeptide (TPR) repeat protein